MQPILSFQASERASDEILESGDIERAEQIMLGAVNRICLHELGAKVIWASTPAQLNGPLAHTDQLLTAILALNDFGSISYEGSNHKALKGLLYVIPNSVPFTTSVAQGGSYVVGWYDVQWRNQ